MKQRDIILVLQCVVALVSFGLLASPALAADEAHGPGLLDLKYDLGIWSVVVFVVLFLVLRKFAWGPILVGLNAREKNIKGAIEEARHLREEMAKQKADFDRQLAEANQQIPRLMESARRDAEHLKEEMRSQAAADIQTERQRLRREIDTARDQALEDIWQHAATLATEVSARAIRGMVTPDVQRRLVDQALNEVQEATTRNPKAVAAAVDWDQQGGGKA